MMGLHTSYRLLLETVGGVVKVFFTKAFKPGALDLTVQDQNFTTGFYFKHKQVQRRKNYPTRDEKSLVPF